MLHCRTNKVYPDRINVLCLNIVLLSVLYMARGTAVPLNNNPIDADIQPTDVHEGDL